MVPAAERVGRESFLTRGQASNVGFIVAGNDWLGGRNYLRNLFAALRTLPDAQYRPVLFSGNRQPDFSDDFPGHPVVRTPMLDRNSPAWFVWKVLRKAMPDDLLMRRLLKRHDISILSHSAHLGKGSGITTVGWIPDFQHFHLPEFFDSGERAKRDRDFRDICENCDKVVVSSECARADLIRWFPEFAHKAELLRFIADPAVYDRAVPLSDLERIYEFESPYFLLPNQFWAHKNHRVVISALQKLKDRGRPLTVLATGSTGDYRNPAFFPSLMQYAQECGVAERFRALGRVPTEHLAGLAHNAVAIINPSRFEGWSTSVEEAKSLGKQVVLSDIPVHREQAPERGIFFPPQDSEALAQALTVASQNFDVQKDALMRDAARRQFLARQHQFAERYVEILDNATGRR